MKAIGAKRVVLDTIEVLFAALDNDAAVRAEFGRLLRWLKDQGLTTVITGERGQEGQLTRWGIEEYVSDCVIVLDHRVRDELATRRLRIVKYRGSSHGTNEYPFLIRDRGLMVWPLTSVALTYDASDERISLGSPQLDEMLGGGVYRGSTVLVSGSAGTGKTTLAAQAVGRRLRARREGAVRLLRGVARPDRAQHALGRHRPPALDRRGAAAALGRAGHGVRPRGAPRRHRAAARRGPAAGRRPRFRGQPVPRRARRRGHLQRSPASSTC